MMCLLSHEFNRMAGTELNEPVPEVSKLLPVGQSNPLPVLIYKILLRCRHTQFTVLCVVASALQTWN